MLTLKKQINTNLHILISSVITLIIIGLLFIYSSSSVYALERFNSPAYFVQRQCIGIGVGLLLLVLTCFIPLSYIKKYTPAAFFTSLALTALTLVPGLGVRINGSSRWVGLAGITFQPSELLKITLLLYVAHMLTKKETKMSSFSHSYLPLLVILGAVSAILLKQPDFGLTVTLATTTLTLLFIAQAEIKYLLGILAAALPGFLALIYFQPYRLKRVLTFLNPWEDPQGAGFQIIQSLIAIGSGSWAGVGISQSRQKFFYLPMQHTDFIFSIIAEETGFIGSCFLLLLYITLLYSGIRIASQLTDLFSSYTVLGAVIVINYQALINIAVANGLVPTKGIGLPFVSYGNSNIICMLVIIGLIINMVHAHNQEH